MDKEVVEHMHETMQNAGRRADLANCPHMEKEWRCIRPRKVQRNNSAGSYYKTTRYDSGHKVAWRVEHELGEEQQGVIEGRGTTDVMFSLRQLVEKRLARQGNMVLAFVDLKKNPLTRFPEKWQWLLCDGWLHQNQK